MSNNEAPNEYIIVDGVPLSIPARMVDEVVELLQAAGKKVERVPID
jgi:hypothetical protein